MHSKQADGRVVVRVLHLRIHRGQGCLDGVVEQFVAKIVGARAAAFDLDEIGGREDRPQQSDVEDVGAVVAGGHHAHGDAHARLAGLVGGDEVAAAQQLVVGEVDAELLRIGDLRGDLHREIRLVLAGEHARGHLVEDLRELESVVLADGEQDGFADFAADRIAQCMLQEGLAQQLVGGLGEEAPLELAVRKGLLLRIAVVVAEGGQETGFGEQLGGDAAARIDHGGVDQVAVAHAIEQRVAEGGLAVLAAEGAVGIQQQAALG
ncbi:hypothetical protein, partial [Metallibacterium sp.]|uniref:hypothetical protein n=1 Tax=Metallibacterium sp. TaxID=2940281 RepID=UPI00261C18B2